MRMLMAILCAVAVVGCALPASAQPASRPSGDLSQQSAVDDILDALDASGKNLNSFTADVKLSETDAATGDQSTRSGKVWYQLDPSGSARIRVAFDKKQVGEKISDDKIEYLLAGPDLIDRTYRARTQVTRHILKPGEKMNLFRLGEGPFPLPIGQSKDDVHAAFDVRKIEPGKQDPPNTVHIQLTPKAGTRLEKRFTTIDVWVDLRNHFPSRIETLDKNQTTIRATDLGDVQINPQLTDADFALPKINPQEWQLVEEAYTE